MTFQSATKEAREKLAVCYTYDRRMRSYVGIDFSSPTFSVLRIRLPEEGDLLAGLDSIAVERDRGATAVLPVRYFLDWNWKVINRTEFDLLIPAAKTAIAKELLSAVAGQSDLEETMLRVVASYEAEEKNERERVTPDIELLSSRVHKKSDTCGHEARELLNDWGRSITWEMCSDHVLLYAGTEYPYFLLDRFDGGAGLAAFGSLTPFPKTPIMINDMAVKPVELMRAVGDDAYAKVIADLKAHLVNIEPDDDTR